MLATLAIRAIGPRPAPGILKKAGFWINTPLTLPYLAPPPRYRSGMRKPFCCYLLASRKNGTLYTGAGIFPQRIWQHRQGFIRGFTKRHGVTLLVYVEFYDDLNAAFERERRIKEWKRRWKLDLINRSNPEWRDLYDELAR